MPRGIYKLGEHTVKLKKKGSSEGQGGEGEQEGGARLPILTRCLERIGDLLKLEKATEDDIKVVLRAEGGGEEGGEGGGSEGVTFYRRGSLMADRIILVYEEEGGEEDSGGDSQGEGEGGEQKKKRKTLRLPIPNWAPNYKVVPVLFEKGSAAGLKIVGAYRHGYMIPGPALLERGGNEGSGE